MANLKKLSNNDLQELMNLIGRIKHEIKDYVHVSELLPKSILNSINEYDEKLLNEDERRYELLNK